jgi:DnaJ-class molecular chaperone
MNRAITSTIKPRPDIVECPACAGYGVDPDSDDGEPRNPCETCRGGGWVDRNREESAMLAIVAGTSGSAVPHQSASRT